MAKAALYFDRENLYCWGPLCEVWLAFVAALLPSNGICIVALDNFFSNIEHFRFQRLIVPRDSCLKFLEASTAFFKLFRILTPIVNSSTSVWLIVCERCEQLFRSSYSLSTEPKFLQATCNDCVPVRNLYEEDFKLLNFSSDSFLVKYNRWRTLFELCIVNTRQCSVRKRHLCVKSMQSF